MTGTIILDDFLADLCKAQKTKSYTHHSIRNKTCPGIRNDVCKCERGCKDTDCYDNKKKNCFHL